MNPQVAEILRSHGATPEDFVLGTREVWAGAVPAMRGIELWKSLSDQFGATGLWPIFRGESEESLEIPDEVWDEFDDSPPPLGTIDQILNKRLQERVASLKEMHVSIREDASIEAAALAADDAGIYTFSGKSHAVSPWPQSIPPKRINLQVLNEAPAATGLAPLALVPVADPAEITMALGFGGWNECPSPQLLSGVLRDWRTRYGAMPACITSSVLECVVERPPQSESECLRLACEQWLLCEDIVSQGTQSVRKLALELQSAHSWFLWWD